MPEANPQMLELPRRLSQIAIVITEKVGFVTIALV
jgi:hypothetical protein